MINNNIDTTSINLVNPSTTTANNETMTSNYSLNSPGPSVCSTNRDKTTTPNNNINTIDAITNNVIYPPLSIYTLNASQDMLLGNLSSTIEQYNKQYKRRYELLQKEEDLWVELLRNGIKRRKNSGISLSISLQEYRFYAVHFVIVSVWKQ